MNKFSRLVCETHALRAYALELLRMEWVKVTSSGNQALFLGDSNKSCGPSNQAERISANSCSTSYRPKRLAICINREIHGTFSPLLQIISWFYI